MSFNNGPTIVTNGLVLALDAGDKNSYVSGSTTWFDLTGVNNGTLVNGPTFNSGSGGSIVFDGVDDYVNLGNLGINHPFHVSFWALEPTGSVLGGPLISFTYPANSNVLIMLQVGKTGANAIGLV